MSNELKQTNKDKKSIYDQSIRDNMAASGDLYEGYLGFHRVTPNLSDFVDNVVASGNKDGKGAALISIGDNEIYGADGADFASRISIVAGLKGHALHEDDLIEQAQPSYDAAGLYVSQRAITQEPWNLVSPIGKHSEEGDFGKSKKRHGTGRGKWYQAQSDVTAYADTVQLVARTGGINLYAGAVSNSLSNGIPNDSFLGVNLIAGNRIDDYSAASTLNINENYQVPAFSLQPLVKGHSLQRYLNRVAKHLQDQASENFSRELKSTITELGDIAALFAGTFSIGAGVVKALALAGKVPGIINSLGKAGAEMYNATLAEVNSSGAFTESYLSRYNKTN
jgi:hypothetical protein